MSLNSVPQWWPWGGAVVEIPGPHCLTAGGAAPIGGSLGGCAPTVGLEFRGGCAPVGGHRGGCASADATSVALAVPFLGGCAPVGGSLGGAGCCDDCEG